VGCLEYTLYDCLFVSFVGRLIAVRANAWEVRVILRSGTKKDPRVGIRGKMCVRVGGMVGSVGCVGVQGV
jgi:hypothetical protein